MNSPNLVRITTKVHGIGHCAMLSILAVCYIDNHELNCNVMYNTN